MQHNIDYILNNKLNLLQTILETDVYYINNILIINDNNLLKVKCDLLRFFYDEDIISLQLTDCRGLINYVINNIYVCNNKIIIPIA